jgi:hypothetical protein
MNPDAVTFIGELGYTPREAAFLYAVGMHSGYFLRRQFDAYIGRVKGAISQHFLTKAERRGHVRAIDYGQNRKVFHLHWKPIYRLLGDEDSQNRRIKGDLQIKSRLMILDYVLRDTREHFLETEQSKVEFFTKSCRLSADVLPAGGPKGRHFPDRFPISTLQPVSISAALHPHEAASAEPRELPVRSAKALSPMPVCFRPAYPMRDHDQQSC